MRIALVRRLLATAAAVSAVILALPAPAAAAPAADLCAVDQQRGGVPSDFLLDACVDGGAVVLHNTLDVPVAVRASGDLGQAEPLELSEAASAGATRLLAGDARVLAPGDVVRWPTGAGAGELVVSALDPAVAAPVVTGLRTFLPALTDDPADADRVLAEVATEVGAAVEAWAGCAAGAGVIARVACDLRTADRVGAALAERLRGRVSDVAAEVALDVGRWGEWAAAADATRAALGHGEARLAQAPAPPPAPAEPPPVEPQHAPAPAPTRAPAPAAAPAPSAAPAPAPAPVPAPVPAPPPVPLPAPVAPPPPGRDLRGEIEQWLRDLEDRFEEHRNGGHGWGGGGRWGD